MKTEATAIWPDVKCVNAHDRCYGGAGGPCPLCELVCYRDGRGRFARASDYSAWEANEAEALRRMP